MSQRGSYGAQSCSKEPIIIQEASWDWMELNWDLTWEDLLPCTAKWCSFCNHAPGQNHIGSARKDHKILLSQRKRNSIIAEHNGNMLEWINTTGMFLMRELPENTTGNTELNGHNHLILPKQKFEIAGCTEIFQYNIPIIFYLWFPILQYRISRHTHQWKWYGELSE